MDDQFRQIQDRAAFINHVLPVLQKYCDTGGEVSLRYEVNDDGITVKLISELLLLTKIDTEIMGVLQTADIVTIYTVSDMVIVELWFRYGKERNN